MESTMKLTRQVKFATLNYSWQRVDQLPPQVTYESVEDVHLTDPNSVYFNVGLESESETSEVLSLPGSSEEVLRNPTTMELRSCVTAFDRAASQPGEKGQKTEAKLHRGEKTI